MAFNWILFLVLVRTCCLAGTGISGVSLCARLDPALCILVEVLMLLGKYLSNTSVTFALCRAWKTNFLKASTYTWSLSSGQLMTQSNADTSYIMVFWTGQLRSDTVTWSFCFNVDFDFEIFISPSGLNIDGGYAANSHANTSSKFMSRELASKPITRA